MIPIRSLTSQGKTLGVAEAASFTQKVPLLEGWGGVREDKPIDPSLWFGSLTPVKYTTGAIFIPDYHQVRGWDSGQVPLAQNISWYKSGSEWKNGMVWPPPPLTFLPNAINNTNHWIFIHFLCLLWLLATYQIFSFACQQYWACRFPTFCAFNTFTLWLRSHLCT